MHKLLRWIGIGLFLGWTMAILVNYSIYQHSTSQLTLIHPIVDGILFMAVLLVVYLFMIRSFKRNPPSASIQLGVLGVFSISVAILFI